MFNNKDLERYSRQIILKKVGILGQSKIKNSKVFLAYYLNDIRLIDNF